ncbi:ABC transporter ATP-binding protein [Mycetocola sp. 2940]|uniref:ABC transporter ATP-binding protein n=1 Tax=Mycetocola sp. 2940 TaxID=3156452 RepID=UPI003390CEEA
MNSSTTGAASTGAAPHPTPLAELVDITKTFGAVVANDSISLTVLPGEVHALLGENGAGKSTLTRILFGLSQPDSGEIRVDGATTRIVSPADAMASGIGMVTQEFSLVDTMTVTENLMLAGVGFGRISRSDARGRVLAAAGRIGVTIDPDAIVETLSVGERQRVEIVKALFHDCRVLILDEPTAVLVPQDVELLFESIERLTADGMGVIFISHKLHEVTRIADRVSILRRGKIVASRPASGLAPRDIAALMVGSAALVDEESPALATSIGLELDETTAPDAATDATPATIPDAAPPASAPRAIAEPALALRGISLGTTTSTVLNDITLSVGHGEIVGIAGVSGNGQTELVSVLCGTLPATGGSVIVAGTDISDLDPAGRIRAGLGRLTEDRKGSVIPALTVAQNLVLEDLDGFRRGPFLDRRSIRDHVAGLIERFDIRAQPGDPIRSLSGGNMQKVLLARAISRNPRALVASQPTRGLDVGACEYVYSQLRALRDAGAGVLLISEDLDELLGICDRIAVIFSGEILGELPAAEATHESLGLLMTGQRAGDAA